MLKPLIAAAIAAAVLLTSACTANVDRPDGAVVGSQSRTIEIDGVQRDYLLYRPASLAEAPALVVFLHGGFGSASQAQSAYGWNELADREGILIAYPDGDDAAWNAGSCCGSPSRTGLDDVAFISAVTAQLQEEFSVEPSRTFAAGMSNGAMMAYRMACETQVFAAIAAVAGAIVTPCEGPEPASVMHIHGLLDERVPFDGSVGSGVTRVDGMAIDDSMALWRAVDDCGEPIITGDPPVATSTATCADGRQVTLITIADAGHQWPGADGKRVADPDAVSTAIDATDVIWAFFDRR